MWKAYREIFLETCPECGLGGMERLRGYSFCVNCPFDEFHECEGENPSWAINYLHQQNSTLDD